MAKRDRILRVRVSAPELEEIDARAEARELKRSAYVRAAAVGTLAAAAASDVTTLVVVSPQDVTTGPADVTTIGPFARIRRIVRGLRTGRAPV